MRGLSPCAVPQVPECQSASSAGVGIDAARNEVVERDGDVGGEARDRKTNAMRVAVAYPVHPTRYARTVEATVRRSPTVKRVPPDQVREQQIVEGAQYVNVRPYRKADALIAGYVPNVLVANGMKAVPPESSRFRKSSAIDPLD